MEVSETPPHHSNSEVANHYACQKLIKSWVDNPSIPSAQVIPTLHSTLMNGIAEYQSKGVSPKTPGVYRTEGVKAEGRPDNFFVGGMDVTPLMQKYTVDLDEVLRAEPISPRTKLEETVHDGAWAYFTFIRIHPYLDGNGRVGRDILKRVFKGRGYKDIIFSPNATGNKKGRDLHVNAMNAVQDSGNLAHLEYYLLTQLRLRYQGDKQMLAQIADVLETKGREIDYQSSKRDLTEIWPGFKGVYLDGVKEPQYTAA